MVGQRRFDDLETYLIAIRHDSHVLTLKARLAFQRAYSRQTGKGPFSWDLPIDPGDSLSQPPILALGRQALLRSPHTILPVTPVLSEDLNHGRDYDSVWLIDPFRKGKSRS